MQLIDWLGHYVKFKDSMKKQIVETTTEQNQLHVKEKQGEKTYFVHQELEALINKNADHKTYFVCLNNKKNIQTLLTHWEELITKKELTILFAHPDSNNVWLINPAVHNSITEKESLKEGIESLHLSIPSTE